MKKLLILAATLAVVRLLSFHALADDAVAVPIPGASGEAVAVLIGDLPSGEAVAVPIGDLAINGGVTTTLRDDGTTNTWTMAELQAALGLMNRMYKREVRTEDGRRRWHGERIGQYFLPTGETDANGRDVMVRVNLYQDGFTYTNRMVRAHRSVIADPEAAAKAAAEAKRRADEARAAWESANLPEDLAALRVLQRAASSTQTVTVIVGP